MTEHEVIDNYRQSIIRYYQATNEGNSRKVNKAYDKIIECYGEIKKQDLIAQLEPLIYDEFIGVRLYASTHILPYNEGKAKKQLSELMNSDNLVSLEAKYTIREWDEGNLREYLETL